MSSYKIKLLISYDGTDFHGWQKQKDQPSIQSCIEKALTQIFSQEIKIYGSGRTDAGAHALGQVAHFSCERDPRLMKDLCHGINSLCPKSITVQKAWLAPEDFHSLFSAKDKTYIYKLSFGDRPDPLERSRRLWLPRTPDLNWLNEAGKELIGKKDFASFQTQGTEVASTVREIFEAFWEPVSEGAYFQIRGSGFLKQMVRNIVGTLIDLERIQAPLNRLQEIIKARSRSQALGTASSHALYLNSVTYPSELDNKCIQI